MCKTIFDDAFSERLVIKNRDMGWVIKVRLGRQAIVGLNQNQQAARLKDAHHFEVDMPNIVIAVLASLAQTGAVGADVVEGAITHYGIDPARVDPYIV